jgi:2-methylisocitrate lyase-like PEP mutase family enzyme
MTGAPRDLARDAELLRSLHRPGDPLLLLNAWDAASARMVERLGVAAVATTSAGVVESLGRDDDSADPDEVFAAVARIAAALSPSLPVTADVEAGYGLGAGELVARLLGAGAVGCNIEDTDHHRAHGGAGSLVDAEQHAARVAAIKEAGLAAGVDVVVNARVDTFVRSHDAPVEEAVRRALLYLAAGADCVYPIGATDEGDIAALVDRIPGPVNVLLRTGTPPLSRLRAMGVARVSVGSGLFRAAMGAAEDLATELRRA